MQNDLLDYRTNVNKFSTDQEPGGTKQILHAISSTRIFAAAIKNIAYKNLTSDNCLTYTTSPESFVLDILVTIDKDKKKPLKPPNNSSQLPNRITTPDVIGDDMTSDRSEISSITEKRSGSTSSSCGSNKLQRKGYKPETEDSEVELLIHLIGPTMGKSNKGQKSYVSIDRNNTGEL